MKKNLSPVLFAASLLLASCAPTVIPEAPSGETTQHLICQDDDTEGWPYQCEKTIPDADGKTWPDVCPPQLRRGIDGAGCTWSTDCTTGSRCDCGQPPADGSARGTCHEASANDPDWKHFGG